MNLKAKLFFLKEERELIRTNVNYKRYTDWKGKPTTDLLDGTITVSFASQMYDDLFIESLFEHRFHKNSTVERYNRKLYKPHNGKIVFYQDDNFEREFFQYNFKDAVIIELYEEFDCQYGMYMTMVISPAMQDYRFFGGKSTWDDIKNPTCYLKLHWMESWVYPNEKKAIKNDEPKLNTYYFEDKNHNKTSLEDITPNQNINLILITENAGGQSLRIDLNSKRLDFIYNDEIVENDILTGIKITGKKTIVPLKTIEQQNN